MAKESPYYPGYELYEYFDSLPLEIRRAHTKVEVEVQVVRLWTGVPYIIHLTEDEAKLIDIIDNDRYLISIGEYVRYRNQLSKEYPNGTR
jgi:hypothetical protein